MRSLECLLQPLELALLYYHPEGQLLLESAIRPALLGGRPATMLESAMRPALLGSRNAMVNILRAGISLLQSRKVPGVLVCYFCLPALIELFLQSSRRVF